METPTEAERRLGLPAGAYPFRSNFLGVDGATVHYVDEGAGPVVLMVHGNPTWSFLYRHLIASLSDRYRCIAVDLPGFGLSEPPAGYRHTPKEHAEVLALAIRQLDLKDVCLVAHDWGGPVGIGAMLATGNRVSALCLGNTFAWPVNGDRHFERFAGIMGGPVGRWATNRFAIFVNVVMPAFMKRRKLSAVECAAYRAPFRRPRTRAPMHVLPLQITEAGPWLAGIEDGLRAFRGPARMIWPENDVAFRAKELAHWQNLLPQADVVRIPQCGHFLWEDAPDECATAVRAFLGFWHRSEPA